MKTNRTIGIGLWHLMNRCRHLLFKIRSKELSRIGISNTSSAVLRSILRQGENATLRSISNDLFFEHHSIREQIMRMEKDGLVKRYKGRNGNRKLIHLEVTDKGREINRKTDRVPNSISTIMEVLTEEEQLELWRLLSKIRERCMKRLRMKYPSLYPQANIKEYLAKTDIS